MNTARISNLDKDLQVLSMDDFFLEACLFIGVSVLMQIIRIYRAFYDGNIPTFAYGFFFGYIVGVILYRFMHDILSLSKCIED
ncbi:hypothetical protein CEXT_569161 [Caerostris extrusa]|uniref:Uncharacterized protein n=1 Tax=Caerostris extrusa TaxID=172846 RepID=A0AAV4TVU5_CAEEX|nr:hypothetical protein CEXT_569161 [Caerostris extrusa]